MIASELISNVVPVLKPEDTCLQALNWMELFRVSHLPMEQGKMPALKKEFQCVGFLFIVRVDIFKN